VAAGSLDASSNEVSYRAHAKRHHYEFQLGRMSGLDRERKCIRLDPIRDDQGREVVPERELGYDTLVMAVGSTANDFGTPGVQEHCLFLDNLDQARRFHRLLLNSYLRKHYTAQSSTDTGLDIAIIGAGATGVELAAELRHASHELPAYGLGEVRPEDVRLTLIEAAPRILPALPERISQAAAAKLRDLSVEMVTGNPVARVEEDSLFLKDDTRLPADMCVWAAGIKAPDWLAGLGGLATNRINQLEVNQDLSTTRDPDIFAFGDCAACPQPGQDQPVPPRAQAAHQQAATLARTLRRRLKGRPAIPYVYRDYGSLINFSRYSAVGNLMGNLSRKSLMVEGRVARLFYISLYHMHRIALHGVLSFLLYWLGDRINRRLQPRLKLH